MKKTLLFALSATAVLMSNAQSSNVFFSEYLEGSSHNKALEIYNGTGMNIDLADYPIIMGNNGGGWSDTLTFPVGTNVNMDDVYVIAHSSADSLILAVADTATSGLVCNFNGDDSRAITYLDGGVYTVLDKIGNEDNDPGSGWSVNGITNSTKDHVLRRNSSVTEGVADATEWDNGTSMNWTVLHKDSISNLGQHTYSTAPVTPTIAFTYAVDTFNVQAPAANLPLTENLGFTSSNVPAGAIIASGIVSPSNDTTSSISATSPIALNITQFGVYAVAVSIVDLSTGPLAADTIYVNVTELTNDSVATIADLRAGTIGESYTLTGEAVITMMKDFRNQKFIEDATAAIVIDDNDGIITGTFNRYDGITNVTGILGEHNGLMQFSPTEDVTSASSMNNTVTPQVITVDEMNNNVDMYESELVTIESATVASADTNIFENGKNLTITDASGNGVFRTQFYDVDYIETLIPGESNYTGIVGRFNATAQLSSRDLADIVASNIGLEEHTEFTIYPNPTSNVLNINFVDANEKVISIYNTIGVNVANFKANSSLMVNTADYNSGMYYLVVSEKGNSTVKQFVVK